MHAPPTLSLECPSTLTGVGQPAVRLQTVNVLTAYDSLYSTCVVSEIGCVGEVNLWRSTCFWMNLINRSWSDSKLLTETTFLLVCVARLALTLGGRHVMGDTLLMAWVFG